MMLCVKGGLNVLCSNCETENPLNAKFCFKCGNNLIKFPIKGNNPTNTLNFNQSLQEYEINDPLTEVFRNDGFECETFVKTVGHSGGSRAAATLMFGLAGFAATSDSKNKAKGRLYMKKRGLRFIPKYSTYIEIRIPWENIIHVGRTTKALVVYTAGNDTIYFLMPEKHVFHAISIIEKKSPLIKYDLDGWE